MGWACQILGRDMWENRDKTGKMLNFPGLFNRNFYCLFLNGRNTPILPFWHQIPSLIRELNQKTPKNYVFEQIFQHFLNFEPLPPLISGLNSKFDYTTLCVLN